MSTSENIKKMTQKFVAEKSAQNLQELSLQDMAQTWSSAKEAPDAEQQKANLSKVANAEVLQNKINEYLVDLNYGRFSPADFPHIMEFCEEFGFKLANTELKSKIENLQETMEKCRLNLPHEVQVKLDDKLKSEFSPFPRLDRISISGNEDQIKDLDDKKQIIGKTVSFMDDNNDTLGGVEFDKDNNAHILCPDKDGNAVEYKLTAGNVFSRINDDKSETLIDLKAPEKLSTQDINAYNLAKASQKVWKKFINKELDKNIQKSQTTVSEGRLATTRVNETQAETENAPQTTRFDEKPSKEKNEGDFKNDTDNETAFPNNDFQWKEDDIIKVMFQDWFLAAANSATNFVLNHVEYAAAGIWNNLQRSYRNRPKEDNKKEPEKPDVTHQFYSEVEEISQKSTKNKQNSCDNAAIIEKIKNGQTKEAVIENDLLRNFGQQTGVDVEGLLGKGSPEKTVPLMTNMAALYSQFTDTYARSAILDAKMQDVHNFDNTAKDALYEQKLTEGGKIVKRMLYEELKKDPKKADLQCFADILAKASKDMYKALNSAQKDYDKKRYNEHGKKPQENKILQTYQQYLGKEEPSNLYEFAKEQSAIISNRDFIISGLNTEQKEIEAAERDNSIKRQKLLQSKNHILKGLGQQNLTNITAGKDIPFRPQNQGRD